MFFLGGLNETDSLETEVSSRTPTLTSIARRSGSSISFSPHPYCSLTQPLLPSIHPITPMPYFTENPPDNRESGHQIIFLSSPAKVLGANFNSKINIFAPFVSLRLRKSIRPPCSSTIFLTIGKPKPVPRGFDVM